MSRTDDRSLTELADAAFQQVAKQVIERAIQTRTPVIVRENGTMRMMKILPDGKNIGVTKPIDSDAVQ
jgi:hypothetical protein